MRLADFIVANVEPILAEWEVFARGIWPGVPVDPATLRDHAEAILRAIAADMTTAQSKVAQSEKSQGDGQNSSHSDRVDRASVQHGADRLQSGFELSLVIAEYRAIRATVLRLWQQSAHSPDVRDLADLTRFNESVDQSLTEAIVSFTATVDRSREMFLAILGHDLRDPLNAITLSARALSLQKGVDPRFTEVALRITNSSKAMEKIVLDLIDFAGSRLGMIPVSCSAMDLREVIEDVVGELRAGHPARLLRIESAGDLTMSGDANRLRQVLANLLGNAIQHGDATKPIELAAGREGPEIVLTVHNEGSPIPQDRLATLFDPLARAEQPESRRRAGSLGLGLYIARAIVTSHGGTLDVQSSAAAGTTFTARLPSPLRMEQSPGLGRRGGGDS